MNRNKARNDATKRLQALYNAVPKESKRKFKPFKFRIVGGDNPRSLPHVFYGRDLEQASEFALIWAEARDLILESELAR